MQSTRRRILNYLAANHLASVKELSRVFGMTPANLRHHLKLLQRTNQVEVVARRGTGGRGRPALQYALTSRAEGEDLERLAKALWDEQFAGRRAPEIETQLLKIASRLVGTGIEKGSNLTQRLYEAVRRLRGMRFDAHWEAHAEGPRIILARCPFASLQDRRPSICQLDAQILNLLLGEKVEQVTTRTLTLEGPRHCIFKVLAN